MNRNSKASSKQDSNFKKQSNAGTRTYNRKSKDKISRSAKKCKDVDVEDAKLSSKGRDNDPNWYFTDAAVADQASQFTFSNFIGEQPNAVRLYDLDKQEIVYNNFVNVPTIMTFGMVPSPGFSNSPIDGINMAALKNFTTLSSRNAKTTQYAPQDVVLLELALGEVVSTMEWARRCFGIAFTYNQRNRALPKQLLRACCVDPDDFIANLANYRLQFNALVTQVNKIPFPSNISYLYKCADMYEKVYLDAESPMAQMYVMVPRATWYFNEAYNDNGSGLVTKPFANGINTGIKAFSEYLTIISNQVVALLTSATLNYIYSDILNYAEKTNGKLFYLDYLLEGYAVAPEYNRNFLLQIHNLSVMPQPTGVDSETSTINNDVRSNAELNIIEYMPRYSSVPTTRLPMELITDQMSPSPSIEDRIESTRFCSLLAPDDTAYGYHMVLPDHYCTLVSVWRDNGTTPALALNQLTNQYTDFVDATNLFSKFDWAPLLGAVGAQGDNYVSLSCYDLNYYTTLDYTWFERVNKLTYVALFEFR